MNASKNWQPVSKYQKFNVKCQNFKNLNVKCQYFVKQFSCIASSCSLWSYKSGGSIVMTGWHKDTWNYTKLLYSCHCDAYWPGWGQLLNMLLFVYLHAYIYVASRRIASCTYTAVCYSLLLRMVISMMHLSITRTKMHLSIMRTNMHLSIMRTKMHLSVKRTKMPLSIMRTKMPLSIMTKMHLLIRNKMHLSIMRTKMHLSIMRTKMVLNVDYVLDWKIILGSV